MEKKFGSKEGGSNNYFADKSGLCISLLLCSCLLLLPKVSSSVGSFTYNIVIMYEHD